MSDNQADNLGGVAAAVAEAPKNKGGRPRRSSPRTALLRRETREEPRDDQRAERGNLVRRRSRTEDRLYIDRKRVPPGMSWEWKRESCFGQPDPDHMTALKENHWEEVDASRYPGLNTKKPGLVLMQRPQYLTDDARAEDKDWADARLEQRRVEALQTPPGTFTRAHKSARENTFVRKSYEPMTVVSE